MTNPKLWSDEKHLEDVTRHIQMVRNNCKTLGLALIERGQPNLGYEIIARGFKHDLSKITNPIERQYLHRGPDVPSDKLKEAINEHRANNDHHREFWGDYLEEMVEGALGEMLCDTLARAQEFGEDYNAYVCNHILSDMRFHEDQRDFINNCLNLLLPKKFSPQVEKTSKLKDCYIFEVGQRVKRYANASVPLRKTIKDNFHHAGNLFTGATVLEIVEERGHLATYQQVKVLTDEGVVGWAHCIQLLPIDYPWQ